VTVVVELQARFDEEANIHSTTTVTFLPLCAAWIIESMMRESFATR
ncbi:MAG TPA: hypothetical protein DDZ03_17515, partial [Shigella sp.]|nr:hypothetical protein [Shigella sp.]